MKLYLVGSGTATYGASADYQLSVGNETCDAVTMGNCEVTIPMGSTSADVMIAAREDGGGEPAETIVLSVVIASAGDTGLMLGSPSSLTLNIVADPTAGFVLSSSTVEEPATGTMEHRVAVSLSDSPAADLILEAGFHSDGTTEIVDDYNSNDEQKRVTFAAGATGDDLVQEVVLIINADEEIEGDETIILTLVGRRDSLTSNGNNFTLESMRHVVTILDSDQPEEPATTMPTISLNYSGSTNIAEGTQLRLRLDLSESLSDDVTVNLVAMGTAMYGASISAGHDWRLRYRVIPQGETILSNFDVLDDNSLSLARDCGGITGSDCGITIGAGSTIVDIQIEAHLDPRTESNETIMLSVDIPSASRNLIESGDPSTQGFNIPAN